MARGWQRGSLVIIGYALASSSLAIINKVALVQFDRPNALLMLQLAFAALTAQCVRFTGTAYVDPLEWAKARAFLPAVLFFFAACFTNMKLLQHVNVDTFIVVRSCSPLVVFAAETIREASVRGQAPQPLGRRMLSLLTLVATCFSAAKYAGAGSADLTALGCAWSTAYLACISAANVFVKRIVQRVPLSSWGLVLYNNALSLAISPLIGLLVADLSHPAVGLAHEALGLRADLSRAAVPVLASCVVGTAISWFGLQARQALSPTSFTVLGVVNKGMTIAANLLVWDRHSSSRGTLWLGLCIGGALCYELAARAPAGRPDKSRGR